MILLRIKNMLRLRRISLRLGFSFGLLLLLQIALCALPLVHIQSMAKQSEEFQTREMRKLLKVQELSSAIESVSAALLQLMTAPLEKRIPEYARVDEKNRKVIALISYLENSLENPLQRQTLHQLRLSREIYQKRYIDLVNQLEYDGQDSARQNFTAEVQPVLAVVLHESKNLLLQEQQLITEAHTASQQTLLLTQNLVILFSALSLLFAILLVWKTTRSVVQPLQQLEHSAQRIAGGDYQILQPDFDTEEITRVGNALSAMSFAISQREYEIEQLAFYDPLTHLPNRTFLFRMQAGASILNSVLMLADIQRLKTVNETLGFDAGDAMINEVANRMKQVLTLAIPGTHAASLMKFSGGSFAIWLSACTQDGAEQLRDRILQSMTPAFRLQQHTLDLNLAFGMAHASDQPLTLVQMLRNAEVALYAAKQKGYTSAWYNAAREASRLSDLSLLSDLRSAVQTGELKMWLQPKLALHNGQLSGFEALVRWIHPVHGFISPVDFIPFAEKTGYISIVTDWMLASAIQQLKQWEHSAPALTIAVNISTADLRNPQFPDKVSQLLQKYNVPAQRLQLEITESGIMEDPQAALALLQHLRSTGVGLSIDDFGTGYSSLAYLRQLPVTELKIDRSFVSGIDSQETMQHLVQAIISMGQALGLKIVAEGIETLAEHDVLKSLGCHVIQGYWYSKPLSAEALSDWMCKLQAVATDHAAHAAGQNTGI